MSTNAPALDGTAAASEGRTRTRLWYVTLVMALVLPLIAAAVTFPEAYRPPEIAGFFVREAMIGVRSEEPGGAKAWQTVAFPYRCRSAPGELCGDTFRITYRHDPGHGPDEGRLWSLYIPSFRGSLAISLNGVPVASSLWEKSVADISATIPLLVPLPAPLLRPGDNTFEFVLTKWGILTSFLDQVAIGPDDRLRPEYNKGKFLFSTLPRLIDGWQFAMGLGLLFIWIARRQEQIFLVFGILLLCHATHSFPALLGDHIPDWVLRVTNHGRLVAAFLVLPLAWLFVGRRLPVPIGAFLAPPLVLALLQFVFVPETYLWMLNTFILPPVALMIVWGIVAVSRAAFGSRDTAAMMLLTALLITMVFAIHDALVLRNALGEGRALLGRLGAPFVVSAISAVLLWRFVQSMNMLDQFSARLTRDIAAAEDALRRSFAREQAQARESVLQDERVRLMSDLHDGIAGQLVAILSLCELRGNRSDEVTDTVRAALNDLRLIVASLDDYGDNLGVMLGVLRDRIEPQLTAHGMTLVWRMADLPELKGLHPGSVLAIYRILQEAATNACRHSGSHTLLFEASLSPRAGYGVRLCLRDRGCGGANDRPGGHGLGNMRRRAESVGAALDIASGPEGTAVSLDLPTRLP